MMPPMNDVVTVYEPVIGLDGKVIKDGRGNIQTAPIQTKARVSQHIRIVRTIRGEEKQSTLEVDLPPSIYVGQGVEVVYVDDFEQVVKGQMITIDETTNLAKNRVHFRTVTLG
jgi:hypothetical protein